MSPARKTAFEYAARILGIRAHSTGELRIKLRKKEYSKREIEEVIAEFTRLGYLNDALFAESLCANLSARGNGKRKIFSRLRTKGIDNTLLKEVLEKHEEDLPEEESAVAALLRKMPSLRREPDERKRKEKALRFLAGRGFSAEAVYAAWNRLSGGRPD